MEVPTLDAIRDNAPIAIRALGLVHAVHAVDGGWFVNGYLVRWDGAGFVCDCPNWEFHHTGQRGHCKHTLAVYLQTETYRTEVTEALEEVVHV